jgi:hypothetical protein
MALKKKSAFLYSYTISDSNKFLDFANAVAGPVITATLRIGTYCLSSLLDEIVRAMQAADGLNTYTATATRSTAGYTQNRITIATSTATGLELKFSTGPNSVASIASLIGFAATDRTGALTYTGTLSTGVYLFPAQVGYTYQPTSTYQKAQGMVNVSAAGVKETLTFSINEFFQVEFKYEPEATAITQWTNFFDWAIQGNELEFLADYTDTATLVRCTLERTAFDGKGQGFMMQEMLPDFPFFYRTGVMHFRKVVS